jgi:two-component system, chemotaxis family, CheB/CheR fusion protein
VQLQILKGIDDIARSHHDLDTRRQFVKNMDVHGTNWPRSSGPATDPIICVVASESAVDELQQFLEAVDATCRMAFVVILREDAERDPQLTVSLGGRCALPVVAAEPGMPCEADRVYIIPQRCRASIEAGHLQIEEMPEGSASPATVDGLLVSLARDQEENSACIVLTDTGGDGDLGMRAMKLHGGICFARTDIERGAVPTALARLADLALPVDELAPRLRRHFAGRRDIDEGEHPMPLRPAIIARMPEFNDILRIRTGHDFSGYRDSRAAQRIERRMHLLQTPDVSAFLTRLRQHPREADLLFDDLLLGLTEFFGDKSAFEALARDVAPQILAERTPGIPIRIWVPACAAGEEAYAVAMIFRELIPQAEKIDIQIFASDIDERSLTIARNGRYSTVIEETVSPERLQRFFVREDGTYRVSRELRDSCLFTKHDLLRHPPFSRMDLVVCRNLLIHLGPDLQDELLSLLHYALRKGGYLFIGESENITDADCFETIDPAHRIFRKLSPAHARQPRFPLSSRAPTLRPLPSSVEGSAASMRESAEQRILALFAPAHVIVNAAGRILQISGRTGKYLEMAQGAPDDNVHSLARAELREELRALLQKAVAKQSAVVSRKLTFGTEGERRTIDLMVQPLDCGGTSDTTYLVLFRDLGSDVAEGWPEADRMEDALGARVRQLERDLGMAHGIQQISTEELETSVEELRSANEEMSALNEELQLVNAELAVQVDELSSALSDIQNLLDSTQVAAIFLDRRLQVRLFTPAATEFFRFTAGDLGRPISDLRPLVDSCSLEHDAMKVMETLEPLERTVSSLDNEARVRMKILPYRTAEDFIGGVVVTFTG